MTDDKNQYDPVTGSVRQPFWRLIFSVIVFYGTLSYLIGSFPTKDTFFQIAANILALLSGVFNLWLNFRPTLIAKSFLYVCMGTMFMLISIRSFEYIFVSHSLFWRVLIILSFVVAYLLPFFEWQLTTRIRENLLIPHDNLLKRLLLMLIFIMPVVKLAGIIFGFISSIRDSTLLEASLIGLVAWAIGIALPFSTNRPIYPNQELD